MRQLVEALDRAERPRRWPWVALAAGGIGTAAFVMLDPAATCPAEDELAEVWNADARGRIEEAFLASGLPSADAAFARTAARLDEYAESWGGARDRLCRDAKLEAADPRVTCLSQRVAAVRSLVEVLADADREVVARAQEAVDAVARVDTR